MPSSSPSSPKSAASPSASSRPSPTPGLKCASNFPVGSQIEGPVTKLMNFGAFVQLADGIEGLVHISEITAERRLNHPSDVLRAGQIVKAQVLAIDPEKRQIKLSMKQLIPTDIDEYIAEHKVGDKVSGRVVEQSPALTTSSWATASAPYCRTASVPPRHPGRADSTGEAKSKSKADQARPVQPLVDAESPLARQRPRRLSQARAAERRPDPQLQNRQA